jgi:hypothetical protein
MSEQQAEQPTEKYLSDFKGDKREQLKAKSAFISKWGYEAYEAIVLRSGSGTIR